MYRCVFVAVLIAVAAARSQEPARLRLEVVDAKGVPAAGIPVALAALRQPNVGAEEPARRWGDDREVVWRGLTDAGGRLEVDVEEIRSAIGSFRIWRMGPRFSDDDILVALDVPGAAHACRVVSLCAKSMSREGPSIRLAVPRTGTIAVDVAAAPGETGLSDALVVEAHHDGPRGTCVSRVPVKQGLAVLPHVVPGAAVSLVVRDDSGEHRLADPVAIAAANPESEPRVRVVAGQFHPILTGRLVDPGGAAVADTSFIWAVVGPGFARESGYVSTDGAGAFRIVSSRLPDVEWARLEMWPGVPMFGVLRITPPPDRKVRYDLKTWPLGPGLHAFGNLILAPVPVIVEGTVVDSEGRPIRTATVEVWVRRVGSSHPMIHHVYTDAGGRFVVHDDLTGVEEDLKVQASVDGRAEGEAACRPGSRDVRVLLGRAGAVHGSFRVPPDRCRPGLNVRAVVEGRRVGKIAWFPQKDGTVNVRISDVPEGAVDVEIRIPGETEPVVIRGLTVRAGVINRPEAFQDVDLR